jgi:hypothetical protein
VTAESEGSEVDDGEALQVDFDFGDPEVDDLEIVKALTQRFVDIPDFDSIALSEIIVDEVGTPLPLFWRFAFPGMHVRS